MLKVCTRERGLFELEFCSLSFIFQECGFSKEQSSAALIFHGSVEKALEALSQSDRQPGERLPPTSRPLARDTFFCIFFSHTLIVRGAGAEHGGSPRRRDNLTEEAEMKLKPSVAVKTTGADHQPPQWVHPCFFKGPVCTFCKEAPVFDEARLTACFLFSALMVAG